MKERDFPIDFLRTLGLFAIILAHVSPPALISQLRSFDVPLMVVISGYVFAITKPTSENTFKLIPYVKNRFVRLAIPVWIFLSFFHPCLYIIARIKHTFSLWWSKDTIKLFVMEWHRIRVDN